MNDNHYAVMWEWKPEGTSAYVDLTLEQAHTFFRGPGTYFMPGKSGMASCRIVDMDTMETIKEER